MQVTSNIPCGNGRVLSASAQLIEVELIAYSKGPRYTFFKISDVTEKREQQIALVPDRHFRAPAFPWKQHVDVWVRYGESGQWKRIEKAEKTPEKVLLWVDLSPDEDCFISTEPPHEYVQTTKELFAIAQGNPLIATVHNIGHSMEQRPLIALRVTASQNQCAPGKERNPVIHVVCGEHATEFSGEEIGRGMLDFVLSDQCENLRQDFIFDFVLNSNPDGNVHGWHQYNAKDWLGHNYSDTVDRSWHHEFVPYMEGEKQDYSSETPALMNWMLLTRPAFYLSMHSWESREGNPGAYHAALESLDDTMRTAMEAINEIAIKAAADLGIEFHARPSGLSGEMPKHLGQYLMGKGVCLAYLPEGNYHVGKETLQAWGKSFLSGCLLNEKLDLHRYDPKLWDVIRNLKE